MKNIKHILFLMFLFTLWTNNQTEAQAGVLTMTGDLSLTSAAAYEAEIKDLTGAGTGHDQVAVTGDVALNGTLDIILDGYTPDESDAFEIMTYGGALSGTFSSINWPAEMSSQGWIIDYGISNPGFVTILGPINSLPVELLSFSVTPNGKNHLLRWETASETNNDYFSVEHSMNGIEFSELGELEGIENSSLLQQYSFTHEPTESGNHFYRLRQVDLSGGNEYSNIISITYNIERDFSFHPNPASGSISFKENVSGLVVYNINGKEVLRSNTSGNTFDLSGLPNGVFLVKINGASTLSQKLIINK